MVMYFTSCRWLGNLFVSRLLKHRQALHALCMPVNLLRLLIDDQLPIQLNATVYLMVRTQAEIPCASVNRCNKSYPLVLFMFQLTTGTSERVLWTKLAQNSKILHDTRSHNIVLNLIERSVMLCIAGTWKSDLKVLKHNQR